MKVGLDKIFNPYSFNKFDNKRQQKQYIIGSFVLGILTLGTLHGTYFGLKGIKKIYAAVRSKTLIKVNSISRKHFTSSGEDIPIDFKGRAGGFRVARGFNLRIRNDGYITADKPDLADSEVRNAKGELDNLLKSIGKFQEEKNQLNLIAEMSTVDELESKRLELEEQKDRHPAYKAPLELAEFIINNFQDAEARKQKLEEFKIENQKNKGSAEAAYEVRKSELWGLATQEYKIHLMPKDDCVEEVVEKLINEIEKNKMFGNQIVQYKLLMKDPNDHFPESDKEGGRIPRVAIYAESKESAQKILNTLTRLFPNSESLGLGAMPRLNQKVNSLIYYAQGSADIKKRAVAAGVAEELLEEDLVHFKEEVGGGVLSF
ncbi:MAG: hypothetical protein ACSNEK_01090 [Parachlamydiaceae bacterium]